MTLDAGTKLGRYEIRSQLGAGGMGEVYCAFDPNLNREVAIKVLPLAFSEDKERLARFEQEISPDGRWFAYTSNESGRSGPDKTLMAVDINAGSKLETSTPSPLFPTQVSSFSAPSRYVVTADGQRFLINAPAGEISQAPITVVMNWTAGLKK